MIRLVRIVLAGLILPAAVVGVAALALTGGGPDPVAAEPAAHAAFNRSIQAPSVALGVSADKVDPLTV